VLDFHGTNQLAVMILQIDHRNAGTHARQHVEQTGACGIQQQIVENQV